jgi:hypothetical protein
MPEENRRNLAFRVILLGLALAAPALGQTRVHPGFNLFTPAQDVELGRASAAEVDRQIPLVHDPQIERYVSSIGQRLAAVAPGEKYPYQFHVTNLSDVNAFALPGGFMYVNRGLIELVATEGQLAGVMAHEMAHVALRHQTNQVSKAYLARAGVGILGGIFGGPNSLGIMRALGGLGLNALFLKFSRTAESQADLVGAQMMSRAGYDPREMADMFELLRRQAGRDPGRLQTFLSDHPAPVDREARVRREAARLRVVPAPPVGELVAVKAELRKLPAPVSMAQVARARAPETGPAPTARQVRLDPPSSTFRSFRQSTGFFRIDYPDNWRVYEPRSGYGAVIAPAGGVVETRDGTPSIVCGAVMNHYDPFDGRVSEHDGRHELEAATEDLIAGIRQGNPHLSPVRGSERRSTVDGRPALSVVLGGPSPLTGEQERVLVVTRELPDGHVLYALFIAPGRYVEAFSPAFDRMVGSLRVDDRAAHR